MKLFTKMMYILGMLILFSCRMPVDVEDIPTVQEVGVVEIKLPQSASSRGILPVSIASDPTYLTQYNIYIFDPSVASVPLVLSASPTQTSVKASVPVGSYSIIVVAINPSYILGAGEQKNISVIANQTTSTTITLNAINLEVTINTPPNLGLGSTFNFSLFGNIGVPSIQSTNVRWTMYDTQSGSDIVYTQSNIALTSNPFLGSPTVQFSNSYTANVGMNVTPTTNKISFLLSQVRVVEGLTTFTISSPSNFFGYGYCPSVLNSNFIKTVVPTEPTGVDLTIQWGTDY